MSKRHPAEGNEHQRVANQRSALWASILIALVAVAGIALRLEDPLSDGVVPAEDPYTHMALVREHMRDGQMEPLYDDGSLYPPGMHAYIGSVWAFTGAELYQIMLLGPAVLGGIGIVGMGLLGKRLQGPVAGVLAAAALAVAPESIFRTSMMSPTALDLAILPYFLLALVEVVRGRLVWLAAAAPIGVFLIAAHPWVLLLLAATAAVFALFVLLTPWPRDEQRPATWIGFCVAAAVLGLIVAITTYQRSAFGTILRDPLGVETGALVAFMVAVVMLPIFLTVLAPRLRDVLDSPRRPHHVAWRLVASLGLFAALVGVTMLASHRGFPEHVDLPRMFGWPILLLAAGGFLVLPFLRGPLAYLGASIVIATYPFVVFNPLNSPFWPHRTAVFFGIGLAILVGVASTAAVRGGRWLAARLSRPAPEVRTARPSWMVPAASLTIALLLGVTVVGASPTGYPGGWYRLYAPCEMDAMQDVADSAAASDGSVVVTASWQAKLVLAALTPDPSRVWFEPSFFISEEERAEDVMHWEKNGIQVFVVDEPFARDELPRGSTGFLDEDPWHLDEEYCHGFSGMPGPRITTYTLLEEGA